jgi:hypothetical integral membrane protein (TIGR02206 family)
MPTETFQAFSAGHLIVLLIGAAFIGVLLAMGRRGGRPQVMATALLAFFNWSAYPLGQIAWLAVGGAPAHDNVVPLHLCDIAAFTAGFALLTRHPLLCALTYFWGLAATLQALVTPNLPFAWPHPVFVMFFVHHFAVVAAALYLPLALGWRPKFPAWRAIVPVYACSLVYLAVAMSANHLLGTNFAFAARPPDQPSLIDHLGPWPWYLLSLQVLALGFFFLLALPFGRPSRGIAGK